MATDTSLGSANEVTVDVDTIGRGAAFGALSFVVGYLLTFVIASIGVEESLGGGEVPGWKAAGWYFYNGMFVDLTQSVSFGGAGASEAGSLIAASDQALLQLIYVVPPIALLIGGFLLAKNLGVTDDTAEAAKAGALVIVSFLVLAILGVFLTSYTASGSFLGIEASRTIEPKLAPAVILAGIVYPLVFGTIGGAAASLVDS